MKNRISFFLLILLGIFYTPEPALFNRSIIGLLVVAGIISLILIIKNSINNKLVKIGRYGIWIATVITLLVIPLGLFLGGGHPGGGGPLVALVWGSLKLSTSLTLISCTLFLTGYLKERKLQ